MKKIISLILLAILIIGCAKVIETKPETAIKPTAVKEPVQAKEIVTQQDKAVTIVPAGQEPETTETEEAQQGPVSEIYTLLMVGETKAIPVGDKTYNVKLLSVSDRAKFLVDSEITKEIMVNGVHTLRDGAEIKLLKIVYTGAEIQIKRAAKTAQVSDAVVPSASGPIRLKAGNFVTVAKTTTGWVEITSTSDGLLLQLQNFRTEPGPGLYVYLVEKNIADGYEVAKLYSREGSQQYKLPAGLDISKYKLVIIYSKSEGKVYGQAFLT